MCFNICLHKISEIIINKRKIRQSLHLNEKMQMRHIKQRYK